jgi:hypothetical protein
MYRLRTLRAFNASYYTALVIAFWTGVVSGSLPRALADMVDVDARDGVKLRRERGGCTGVGALKEVGACRGRDELARSKESVVCLTAKRELPGWR